MDLSVHGLLDSVKLSGTFPDGMFEDADYVKFLNESYFSDILPFIMKHREDYYTTYVDYDFANSIIIPPDAIANKISDVSLVSSDGKTIEANLPRLGREELANNRCLGFYPEGNYLKFYPQDVGTGRKVRVTYYARPLPLELPDNIATIESYLLGVATVDQIPTWVASTTCVITPNYQPYAISTGTITGSNAIDSTITIADCATGYYLSRIGYRAIADLPLEVRDVLVQGAILKAMVSIKDKDGVKLAAESLAMAKDNASTILTPRVDNEVKKLINTSGLWSRNYRRF